jgi:hypothetical protein
MTNTGLYFRFIGLIVLSPSFSSFSPFRRHLAELIAAFALKFFTGAAYGDEKPHTHSKQARPLGGV